MDVDSIIEYVVLFSVIASNYHIKNDSFLSVIREFHSQVDFPESPETPEIKSDQRLNQTKRDINKLCLGNILPHKTLRMKLSLDSR